MLTDEQIAERARQRGDDTHTPPAAPVPDLHLTDNQRTALWASCRKAGARILPPAARPDDRDGVRYQTALILIHAGLATAHCPIDGENLTLDRNHRYRDGGTLHALSEGRAILKVAAPERQPLYLARPGGTKYRVLPNRRWAIDDRTDGQGDYTTDPNRSVDTDRDPVTGRVTAVEALVTPTDLLGFARNAEKEKQAKKASNGRDLDEHSPRKRLALLRENAKLQHADVSSDARLIDHLLRNGREPAAIKRLVHVETLLGLRNAA